MLRWPFLAARADLPALPSLAIDPQLPAPDWKGFYVGGGVSLGVAKGAKGQVGEDVFVGYDRPLDNGLILGVRFDTGTIRGWSRAAASRASISPRAASNSVMKWAG